jgi:two-component system, NtrC family, sensor kinase
VEAKHYKKLRVKIVVMSLCFSLIPLFALGLTIYHQFSKTYENKITEDLTALVQNRRSSLELFFEERIAQLVTVANTHILDELRNDVFLGQVFNSMQSRAKSFVDIGVIDQDGNHLAYVGPFYEKLKGVNYANEDWFHSTVSAGLYVSDVFLGFRKIPHFIIAVTRREGNRIWILRATINSDIIDNIVLGGQKGKTGDAFVINRHNILQTQPRFTGKVLSTPDAPNFSFAVGNSVSKIVFRGEESLFATSQLNNPRWVVVLKEDPKEALEPLFEARYIEALILILGIVVVVVGTVFTTQSMTNELIRIERQKAESDDLVIQSAKMAALGKMAAGVAHEINNPLQIIGDQAGWMKDLLDEEEFKDSPNYKEFQECIRKIHRHLDRCRSITHRLLRFGRRMEPTHEMVDVNEILTETVTFLESEARFREIEIVKEYGSDVPRITTDQAQLQQVFLNIIDNAIDAIGKSGHIWIRTGRHSNGPSAVVVEIQDDGPGIPKDRLAKIFDPFFTTKAANEGTGLGLSISFSIIEKLGGKIVVSSREGEGTTFSIQLPVG